MSEPREERKLRDMDVKLDTLLVVTARIEERLGQQGIQISDHESRLREHSTMLSLLDIKLSAVMQREGRVRWMSLWPAVGTGCAVGGFLATVIFALLKA